MIFIYSKKNNTNNLDKIEKYSNEQDKIIEANKEYKSNIKKKEKIMYMNMILHIIQIILLKF